MIKLGQILRIRPSYRSTGPQIYVVSGGLFGDEGKGMTVARLAQRLPNVLGVVRLNGGPNAGHNILTPNFSHFCHNQLNSASSYGLGTIITPDNFFLDPSKIIQEAERLSQVIANTASSSKEEKVKKILEKTKIDSRTPIILPTNILINIMEEILNNHGTIGVGMYSAFRDKKSNLSLTFGEIFDEDEEKTRKTLTKILKSHINQIINLIKEAPNDKQKRLIKEFEYFFNCSRLPENGNENEIESLASSYSRTLLFNLKQITKKLAASKIDNAWEYIKKGLENGQKVIIEGAQGNLLDPDFGFLPFVTACPSTGESILELLKNHQLTQFGVEHIIVIRPYITSHGPRPMPTEIFQGPVYERLTEKITAPWPAEFRVGWMDSIFLRYSMALNEPEEENVRRVLAVTNLDRFEGFPEIPVATSYMMNLQDEIKNYFEIDSNNYITQIKKPNVPLKNDVREKITNAFCHASPIYRIFSGWKTINHLRSFSALPESVKDYLDFLSTTSGLPLKYLSVDRFPTAFIELVDYFARVK